MRTDFSKFPLQSDDDLRLVRMARGLRAVAVAIIVGGIAVVALESAPPAQRSKPTDPIREAASEYAVIEPHSAMSTAAPASQAGVTAARETEPAFRHIDRAMESHG